ncbi:MAG TPA: isocitrate/isopropylmalate dehydrogenase family protein [Thermoplasmata archaeon]|nr:isocitrate/isopropylmalate dehydrogenase family protein [Thermoplasmata archaeon]
MYRIAVIPGDGVGPEVVQEGVKVLKVVGELHDLNFDLTYYPNGAKHYLKSGETLSEEQLEEMRNMNAVFFGAVGDPRVKPGILEKGILLKIRFYFDQYINLRPILSLPGLSCPLKGKTCKNIQFYVVRENTEDFYIGLGSRFKDKRNRAELNLSRELYEIKMDIELELKEENEIAYQIGLISRGGAKRVIRYAFELAERKNRRKVTLIDKANVMSDIYGLWRDVFDKVSREYKGISTDYQFVDNAAMQFVKDPGQYEVIVVPNLFGDVLTDLGAAIQGSIGTAASGNINPGRVSMFEPIHGSAPDIAGKGIANPIGAISACAMMLEELKEYDASDAIEKAIRSVILKGKVRTPDLEGMASTAEMGNAIIKELG